MAKKVVTKETTVVAPTNEVKTPKFKQVGSCAEEFKFDVDHPIFEGIYQTTKLIGLGSVGKPEGFFMHVFIDPATNEEVLISSSHAITQAIEDIRMLDIDPTKCLMQIEFKGKTLVKGKPFNRFKVAYVELCDLE